MIHLEYDLKKTAMNAVGFLLISPVLAMLWTHNDTPVVTASVIPMFEQCDTTAVALASETYVVPIKESAKAADSPAKIKAKPVNVKKAETIVKKPVVGEHSEYQGVIWFLKSQEHFSPVAFWDFKQASWGFGSKAPKVGARITLEEANVLFVEDINQRYAKLIKEYPNLKEDRLVALVLTNLFFNIGTPGGNLSRAIAKYDPDKPATKDALCKQMLKYVHAGGKVLPGLEKRRKLEVELIKASDEKRQILFEQYRQAIVKHLANVKR